MSSKYQLNQLHTKQTTINWNNRLTESLIFHFSLNIFSLFSIYFFFQNKHSLRMHLKLLTREQIGAWKNNLKNQNKKSN